MRIALPFLLLLASPLFAAEPKELDILGKYVGHWTSDVTNKPAVWDEKGTKFRTINQAEWILDGRFLQHIEVNHIVGDPEKVTKSLFLWTYDPTAKKYVNWAFQSTGNGGPSTGKWNSTSGTFTLVSGEPPPNTTGKLTEQFLDANTIKGNLTFLGDDGKTLMDMVWTRNRQSEDAGKATREKWKTIGTPIRPLPDEMKKLQPLIGEWDSEFINGPSVVSPQGSASKGRLTAQWILDGRFLLGTSEVGKHRSIWVIGYDPHKKAYRNIRFTNGGEIDESVGQWNEDTRSFEWKFVNERPGITTTSTTRIVGREAIQARILAENKDGKVHRDLTIKSSRRKAGGS